jgi:hypothetical protein
MELFWLLIVCGLLAAGRFVVCGFLDSIIRFRDCGLLAAGRFVVLSL